jgi:hypothetical protein
MIETSMFFNSLHCKKGLLEIRNEEQSSPKYCGPRHPLYRTEFSVALRTYANTSTCKSILIDAVEAEGRNNAPDSQLQQAGHLRGWNVHMRINCRTHCHSTPFPRWRYCHTFIVYLLCMLLNTFLRHTVYPKRWDNLPLPMLGSSGIGLVVLGWFF